jgi:hypothetical protein
LRDRDQTALSTLALDYQPIYAFVKDSHCHDVYVRPSVSARDERDQFRSGCDREYNRVIRGANGPLGFEFLQHFGDPVPIGGVLSILRALDVSPQQP